MCIIAACRAGAPRPDNKTVARMWECNPDGAGIMWAAGNCVHGRKGFMTLDALQTALACVPDGAPLVIHFRIATSGGINPEMTHPFPVVKGLARLRALQWEASTGIAHNGVLPGLGTKTLSDTAEYIRRVAAPVLASGIDEADKLDILRATSHGSRLALLHAEGRIDLFGDWIEDTGIYYSNSGFRAQTVTPLYWSNFDTYCGIDRIEPLDGVEGYVMDDTGELDDPDWYGVDDEGTVYFLDDAGACMWYPLDGFRAYTVNGQTLTASRVRDLQARYNVCYTDQ